MQLSASSTRKSSLTSPRKVWPFQESPKKGHERARRDNCPPAQEPSWARGGVVGTRWGQALEGAVEIGMFPWSLSPRQT